MRNFKLGPEAIEQRALVQYLSLKNYKFSSIPHGTYTTKTFANLNKSTGLIAGLPDLMLILKRGGILFIEMKRPCALLKSGELGKSPSEIGVDQIEWITSLNEQPNTYAVVALGSRQAIEYIERIERDGKKIGLGENSNKLRVRGLHKVS